MPIFLFFMEKMLAGNNESQRFFGCQSLGSYTTSAVSKYHWRQYSSTKYINKPLDFMISAQNR